MHSNGGRGLVAEARSPDIGESRQGGDSVALTRQQSPGGEGTDRPRFG